METNLQFLAKGTSHPAAGLELMNLNAVAQTFGISPPALFQRLRRGSFPVQPALVTPDGRRYWNKPDVLRAKELLSKPALTQNLKQEAVH